MNWLSYSFLNFFIMLPICIFSISTLIAMAIDFEDKTFNDDYYWTNRLVRIVIDIVIAIVTSYTTIVISNWIYNYAPDMVSQIIFNYLGVIGIIIGMCINVKISHLWNHWLDPITGFIDDKDE